MSRFKIAFALVAVIVILAAPAYASNSCAAREHETHDRAFSEASVFANIGETLHERAT